MKPATRAGLGARLLLPANQQPRQSPLVDGRRGDGDAGEAGTEHAAIAISVAASPRWGGRARDQATPGYSRFCDLLRGFERRLTPVMRQHHVAGEKAFVDYSGKRIAIADPTTGEIR